MSQEYCILNLLNIEDKNINLTQNFYKIEMFLFSLEWNEKPFFDYVDVETQEGIYSYRIRREHDTFYLIAD